jgi:hypothetical protein
MLAAWEAAMEQSEKEKLACANYLGIKPELIHRIETTEDGEGHFTGLRVIIDIPTGRQVRKWVEEHIPR